MVKEIVFGYIISKAIGKKRSEKINFMIEKHTPKLSALLLIAIAIGHTLRVATNTPIEVGNLLLPTWASVLIAVIASILGFKLFKIKSNS